MKVLVSVIVPCYNVEHYLVRCIKTLLSQSLTAIEIILVDDGSCDNVPYICDEWKNKDSRIKVIHKQNAGLGYARNSGLEIATGEYVAFVDSDDFVSECMFLTLYNEAKNNDADVVFCGYQVEDAKGHWHDVYEYNSKKLIEGIGITDYLLDMIACAPNVGVERKHAMSVWHGIYKKSLIDNFNIRFMSEREVVSEDLPFHVDILLKAQKIVCIPDCFYHYCFNDSSLTASFKPEKYDRFRYLYSILINNLQDIPGAVLRIDRFLIGYTRGYIQQLLNSNRDDIDKILIIVVNDKIWDEIGNRYKPSYLSVYARFFYVLQIKKWIKLLKIYARMTLTIKKVFGYKY